MYDLIVIGAGSGGLAAAKRAAKAQKKVLLIENDTIGGTCVSYGCVPKKLWHQISHTHFDLEHAKSHGWSINTPTFNWGEVKSRLSDFIKSLNNRHKEKCLAAGIDIVNGTAQLTSPTQVTVNNKCYDGKHILIAVGSTAQKLPIPGTEYCDTSYEFFAWDNLPNQVVVWGGGYIAVELASILNALGSTVHLIIRQSSVLRGFDEDLREFLHSQYENRGITIHNETSIEKVVKHNDEFIVHCTNGVQLKANKVLQALGRVPNTTPLNCSKVGIDCDNNGAIIVDDNYQTSVKTISALGDCIDRVQLTPVAIAQAREWVDNVLLNKSFPVDYRLIPTAVFSHPEAATIGLTESDAKNSYDNIDVKKLVFNPLTMALNQHHKEPVFIKLVINADNNRILGIHLSTSAAAEIVQSLAIAMQKGITKDDLDLTMALHPSVMEELVTIY